MFNMLLDRLPSDYKGYLIRTDYRIGIQISLALDDPELNENDRVMVALSLLAAMVTFLFCVASAVCELGCIVLTLLSLILFIGGQTVGGIVFLVLAFLVSPFGVPVIAEWLVDKLHSVKFALRDFITG